MPPKSPSSTPTPVQELAQKVLKLLNEGQTFLAYDTALEGIKLYPHNFKLRQYAALALLRTAAVEEAKAVIQPCLDVIEGARAKGLSLKDIKHKEIDEDVIQLVASIYKETWRHTRITADLEKSRDLYALHFQLTHSLSSGASAAALSWLVGDSAMANDLATQVVQSAHATSHSKTGREAAALFCALGEAHMILEEVDLAEAMYTRAQAAMDDDYTPIVAALHQLKLLHDAGYMLPPKIFAILKPPTIVVFTGQMLDFQGQTTQHFMPDLEENVKAEIERQLTVMEAKIGYSSASCGSDIIFIETMLACGLEVNIVLPFDKEDFIASNVRPAGPRWEARFHKVLEQANSVSFSTEERFLGHTMLYRFANMMLHGLAEMRGDFLLSPPHLLAVWDSQPDSLVGGAADFIDHWPDIRTFHLVDLDEIKNTYLAERGLRVVPPHFQTTHAHHHSLLDTVEKTPRIIKTMLFSDLAGFSKLKEEHIPGFLEFLSQLKKTMEEVAPKPNSLNTWGDALFVVMENASDLAAYALTLSEVVPDLSSHIRGLPPLNIRTSLHAGPVYEATDPFRGQANFYGGHINRAARLEPVTVIGQVYATEQFMALLTAEQSAQRVEKTQNNLPFIEPFGCEYVGVVSLAKGFGTQPVYHLRWL